MKSILALAFPLIASAACAPAQYPMIKISIINDLTGHSATATVPTDGLARNIPDLFANSAVDTNGHIFASSAQLIDFTQKTHCFFQSGNWIIDLNATDKTFADLDGQKEAAWPIWMNGFNLQCSER